MDLPRHTRGRHGFSGLLFTAEAPQFYKDAFFTTKGVKFMKGFYWVCWVARLLVLQKLGSMAAEKAILSFKFFCSSLNFMIYHFRIIIYPCQQLLEHPFDVFHLICTNFIEFLARYFMIKVNHTISVTCKNSKRSCSIR